MVPRVSLDRPPHEVTATVLGAGTMGAQIAAHLANAGVRTFLLDIVPKGVEAGAPASARNAIVLGAMKGLQKARPPAYMDEAAADRITVGNFDDDLAKAVSQSDLVIEAIIERLDIKQSLFSKVAAAAKPTTILATNTSGIPISAIAQALPEDARKRFVGLHFFNPPRWMHLLEVIPSSFTDASVCDEAARFCEVALGKGIVPCRDTPNFIGNRIGIAEMLLTFEATTFGDYTIEEVDMLNGSLMGRPKTGSYRLGDMVGLDVIGHVVKNLREGLSGDPSAPNYDPLYDRMALPAVLETLLERKAFGDKSGGGFYKKNKLPDGSTAPMALDLKTQEYRPRADKPRFDELKAAAKMPTLERKIHDALRVDGRAGTFLRRLYLPLFNYAATLTGTICETPKQIDDAMCWGYGWKLGPFGMMDAAGLDWVVEQMKAADMTPAPALAALVEAKGAGARWYGDDATAPTVHVPGRGEVALPEAPGFLFLDRRRSTNELAKNSSAGLIDIGDGVACLEFRSKANVLDEGVVTMMGDAPELLRSRGFTALVIGNQDEHFCRGANLLQIAGWIMQKKWDELDAAVNALQQVHMNLRHGSMPVVVAPFGQTLGGGCELTLHAASVQAGADLFMGLVEIAVGVLPAGGGLKEIARRASNWASQVADGDPFAWIKQGSLAAATAKISMSAHEARKMGFLRDTDGITFHRGRLIADAKKRALSLVAGGWTPPDRNEAIRVVGAPQGANIMFAATQFAWGGYATDHDKLIAQKIAHVLSGGMTVSATTVTAQTLLDLEREAFLSLCGTDKTFARIQSMLTTQKPLRN